MSKLPSVSAQERASVLAALTSALKHVSSLEVDGGVLAQAWLPDEQLRLHTKGLPFSLIGSGDLLALFRCLSCKFTFSTDLRKLALMGSPGRVFSTGEAETSDNVQQIDLDIYLRNREAKACRIFSTVHLPLFTDPGRKRPVAVLEITQFKGSSTSYQAVFDWSRTYLQAAGIYLPLQIETQTFEMRSHAMSIRYSRVQESSFGGLFKHIGGQAEEGVEAHSAEIEDITEDFPATPGSASGQAGLMVEALMTTQEPSSSVWRGQHRAPQESSGEGSEDDMLMSEQQGSPQEDAAAPAEEAAYGKSSLTKSVLEAHFVYSLSEAARRLGVSNTTVKRACRRYGIARWPRQEIMKAAAAEKEAAEKASPAKPSLSVIPWGHDYHPPRTGSFVDTLPPLTQPFDSHRQQQGGFNAPSKFGLTPSRSIPSSSMTTGMEPSSLRQWGPSLGKLSHVPSVTSPFPSPSGAASGTGQNQNAALPRSLREEDLDMSLEALTAIADNEMGPMSDLPPGWSMDLDDNQI